MADYLNHDLNRMTSRILEVRYTDLGEELRLCQELLVWAKENDDLYAQAFAQTYLGDYYIAIYDTGSAGTHLLEVEQLLKKDESWDELRLRVFSLLGIYYEMRADEQNAIEYYLEAIEVAESVKDVEGECAILNNLAYVFQRHKCYDEALAYYEKAYQIQTTLKETPIRSILLVNLAEVLLSLHRYDEARKYIEECEYTEKNEEQRHVISDKNWCEYYAAIGEKEKALTFADRYLENQEIINKDKLVAFDTYHTLCQTMMNLIVDKRYAKRFLNAMETVSSGIELDQVKLLEDAAIKYALLFEPPELHPKAYKRFYEKNQLFRSKVNESIANAMKSKIRLDQLMQQTKQMQSELEILEQEVDHDEMTGLYSRGFMERLGQKYTSTQSAGALGIVVFDVDFFKEYNDFYGHMEGDFVLKEVASCMQTCRQSNIYPCRYGGDEFVCVCDGISETEIVTYIVDVRACLHSKAIPHVKSQCAKEITLSIGYAIGEENIQVETHVLFQLADQALYQSKRSGRNTYTRKRMDIS